MMAALPLDIMVYLTPMAPVLALCDWALYALRPRVLVAIVADNVAGVEEYVDNATYDDTLMARSRLRNGICIDSLLRYSIVARRKRCFSYIHKKHTVAVDDVAVLDVKIASGFAKISNLMRHFQDIMVYKYPEKFSRESLLLLLRNNRLSYPTMEYMFLNALRTGDIDMVLEMGPVLPRGVITRKMIRMFHDAVYGRGAVADDETNTRMMLVLVSICKWYGYHVIGGLVDHARSRGNFIIASYVESIQPAIRLSRRTQM